MIGRLKSFLEYRKSPNRNQITKGTDSQTKPWLPLRTDTPKEEGKGLVRMLRGEACLGDEFTAENADVLAPCPAFAIAL
jgi:hypothetical protein